MSIIIVLLFVVLVLLMVIISDRKGVFKAKKDLRDEQEKVIELEKKLESLRVDVKKSKDELERGKADLREARELVKKKLKRKNEGDNDYIEKGEIGMTAKALEDSYKVISAMETQIENLKDEQNKERANMDSKFEEKLAKESSQKDEEINELKNKILELTEEIKKQKKLLRPEGQKIDLKTLPDEAAAEFSRVYRKAEQQERLHGVARAKLHLAQEKFTELQKRYFSVCRELALLSGNKEITDDLEARKIAEEKVESNSSNTPSNH